MRTATPRRNGLRVRVVTGDPEPLRWLEEFLTPSFERAPDGDAECRVALAEDLAASLLGSGPRQQRSELFHPPGARPAPDPETLRARCQRLAWRCPVSSAGWAREPTRTPARPPRSWPSHASRPAPTSVSGPPAG
jgi:hypothetical protein